MHRDCDDALSELIGFVLLLGILTVALSLYITYSVPVYGRENEIAHMNYISQQMVGVKGDIDSLWVNNRQNVPIYRSITLGTQSGLTQGGFSAIPLLSPIGSSGTLAINEKKEGLTIDIVRSGTTSSPESDIILYPGTPVWLNVVFNPGTTIVVTDMNGAVGAEILEKDSNITISTFKNGTYTISNATIVSSPVFGGIYPVNILDGAYGLGSGLIYPVQFRVSSGTGALFTIPSKYTIEGDETLFSKNNQISHQMGSIDYRSKNNYWVYQNYYYQNGGVFLKQDEGPVVLANPEISVREVPSFQGIKPYTLVTVTDLVVQQPSGASQIGGAGPVQLMESTGAPDHTVVTNLQKVTISVSNSADTGTADMWRLVFREVYPGNPSGAPQSDPALTVSANPVILDYRKVPVNANLLVNRMTG